MYSKFFRNWIMHINRDWERLCPPTFFFLYYQYFASLHFSTRPLNTRHKFVAVVTKYEFSAWTQPPTISTLVNIIFSWLRTYLLWVALEVLDNVFFKIIVYIFLLLVRMIRNAIYSYLHYPITIATASVLIEFITFSQV